jgi:glucose/mannose-6-phosphate isomerase
VVVGSGPTAALARRWKTQLNENAELAAFASELPEGNHNEICGWERGADRAPLAAVFLVDSDQHPRVRRRIELTCNEVERAGGRVQTAASRGESRLERVLSLLLLGDLTSVYLAVLEGADPSSVEPIERFKQGLDE